MPTNNRSYVSQSRQAGAQETRERILAAARSLFAQNGFEKTTVGEVAQCAGVSAPSVYALYKSKEGLLREIVHRAAFGEAYQALVEQVLTQSDAVECLRTSASITRLICEAENAEIGLIRGNALIPQAFKELEEEGERIRYERQEVLVRRLFDADVVRSEIDFSGARDIVWSLTSREMWRRMVVERGWPPERFEFWLAETLIKALVRDDVASSGRTA